LKWDDLKGKKLVIYGTGHVGHKFLRAVKRQGLADQILCFAVTGPVKEETAVEGIPVYGIHDIQICKDTTVCLAVHDALLEEVEQTVRRITDQYVWIYPDLYSLMFGEPEQTNVEVSVYDILKNYREDFRLAVRLAVIEQEEGKNQIGFDYYIKAQMLHCSLYTAKQRLEKFRQLISDWKKQGYQKEYSLSLNQNYEMIDGNHRLSLAVYYGQKRIICYMYPTKESAAQIHGQGAMLQEKVLLQNGFVREDIERLKEIQQRYMALYEK